MRFPAIGLGSGLLVGTIGAVGGWPVLFTCLATLGLVIILLSLRDSIEGNQ